MFLERIGEKLRRVVAWGRILRFMLLCAVLVMTLLAMGATTAVLEKMSQSTYYFTVVLSVRDKRTATAQLILHDFSDSQLVRLYCRVMPFLGMNKKSCPSNHMKPDLLI